MHSLQWSTRWSIQSWVD